MKNTEEVEAPIFEDLCMIRLETFTDSISKREEESLKKLDEIEVRLFEDIATNLKKEDIKNEALNVLDDLLSEITAIQNFWNEIYYKEGIADAVRYKKYLLNELCVNTFESNVLNVTKQKFRENELRDKLTNIVINNIKNSDIRKIILLRIDKLIRISSEQKKFWRAKCYKKGYCDVQQLMTEIKQYKL